MKRACGDVVRAFGYFSILPIPASYASLPPSTGSLLALPIVGAIIGALAGGVALLLSHVVPLGVALVAALVLQLTLSGLIHVDGFLDSCDALFASVPVARRHEILKDTRHGTYAVGGMALLAVVWIAALGTCNAADLPMYLAFTGATARFAAIAMTPLFRYVGSSSASPLQDRSTFAPLGLLLVVLLVWALFVSQTAWIAVIAALVLTYGCARWVAGRLGGGLVGDSYGLFISMLEPIVLIVVAGVR